METNNLPDTVGSVISLLPATKEQINIFANKVVEQILAGEIEALRTDYILKCFEMVAEKIRKDFRVQDVLFDEVEKNGKQEFMGAKGVSVQSKTTYDYSQNPSWVALDTAKKELEKQMKAITETMVNTQTGEEMQPAKVKSISKYIKYDFKGGL